jgi:hypothetical protein
MRQRRRAGDRSAGAAGAPRGEPCPVALLRVGRARRRASPAPSQPRALARRLAAPATRSSCWPTASWRRRSSAWGPSPWTVPARSPAPCGSGPRSASRSRPRRYPARPAREPGRPRGAPGVLPGADGARSRVTGRPWPEERRETEWRAGDPSLARAVFRFPGRRGDRGLAGPLGGGRPGGPRGHHGAGSRGAPRPRGMRGRGRERGRGDPGGLPRKRRRGAGAGSRAPPLAGAFPSWRPSWAARSGARGPRAGRSGHSMLSTSGADGADAGRDGAARRAQPKAGGTGRQSGLPARALAKLDELRMAPLLHGARGEPSVDREALARAIAGFSPSTAPRWRKSR